MKNKEIEALDLAIDKLTKEKEKVLKNSQTVKLKKEKEAIEKIAPKDRSLIAELTKLCKWWRTKGQPVEKTIKVTVKANILWTEEKQPYIDGYNFFVNGEEWDSDEHVRGDLFEAEIEKARKSIDTICVQADRLETKYGNIDLGIFT